MAARLPVYPSPVVLVSPTCLEAHHALSLFTFADSGESHIVLHRRLLESPAHFEFLLARELVHFAQFKLLGTHAYRRCPKIFTEGLSEFIGQSYPNVFANGQAPLHPEGSERAWSPGHELGRCIVAQIVAEEGFGLEGFIRVFLRHDHSRGVWGSLDHLFRPWLDPQAL
ncbi:MAG: hypothetical protein ACFCBW_14860 [Candidatus Competibacterales bacterium]